MLDTIEGTEFHLFGAHPERALRGAPGRDHRPAHTARSAARPSTARSGSRTSSAATRRGRFKLPATRALALAGPQFDAPEIPVPSTRRCRRSDTFREIAYEEHAGVGYLHFDFYNGAMSTDQCRRLHDAYRYARSRRHTSVIVLMGGSDFFSNGIHLNVIEAADDPAAESWRNLLAIDDVVREIIETDSHLVVSALGGDAAAGGVPFALAADHVVAREDVVLNPYYRHMGGLYGSEYWTYLLPRRVGAELTARLTGAAVHARRHAPGGRDRPARRRLRRHRRTASARRSARLAERLARDPDARPLARGQAAPARARRASASRSTPTARRSSPARTRASSATTAATTRRAGASSTSSAHRAPSRRRPRCPRDEAPRAGRRAA